MMVEVQPILSQSFIAFLEQTGRSLSRVSKVKSARQWLLAERAIQEYESMPEELRTEITKDLFCMEATRHLNQAAGFPVMTETGATLDWWMKIAATYKNLPILEEWKKVLSFDHFSKAKWLYNNPNVPEVASPDYALAIAYDRKLSAEAMVQYFTDPQIIKLDPQIESLRRKYIKGLWPILPLLLGMNGDRQQAEYHLNEFQRLAKENELSG